LKEKKRKKIKLSQKTKSDKLEKKMERRKWVKVDGFFLFFFSTSNQEWFTDNPSLPIISPTMEVVVERHFIFEFWNGFEQFELRDMPHTSARG